MTPSIRIIPPAKAAAQTNTNGPSDLPTFRSSDLPSSSAAKIAANQANAQRSTGPTSPEGKAAVSVNAVKHGMCSKMLTPEENTQYERLLAAFTEHYRPAAENETALVKQVAEYHVRMDRSVRIETALFDRTVKEIQEENPKIGYDEALALIFMDPRFTSRLNLHMRYHAQISRGWHKAITELEKAIKARRLREQEAAAQAEARAAATRTTPIGGFVSYSAPQPSAAPSNSAQTGAPAYNASLRR